MFIKFEEVDLFDFFENNPAIIGEYEEGNWLYSFSKRGFEIVLLVSIYEMYVEISLTYDENILYNQKHNNVVEIRKSGSNNLRLLLDNEKEIIIKKEPQIGVVVE